VSFLPHIWSEYDFQKYVYFLMTVDYPTETEEYMTRTTLKQVHEMMSAGNKFGLLIGIESSHLTAKLMQQVESNSIEQYFLPYSPEVFFQFSQRKLPVYMEFDGEGGWINHVTL